MAELTSRERIGRILARKPVDRIGVIEHFWGDTQAAWAAAGHVDESEDLREHFDLDIASGGWLNMKADLDFEDQVVEEDDQTRLVRDGNGALLRSWKHKSGTPEHVDFLVKDRAGWQEHIRPHLVNADNDRRRVNVEGYREAKAKAAEAQRFFCWGGVNVFECMHPVCGHEHMLVGMALDPDWVRDMCTVYADLILRVMETVFAEEGQPGGIWFYEDMGFKHKPFMSPKMYKEIIWPSHKRTFAYAHSIGCPVVVHSCGYVEPLVEGLIEAGMDCLQAIEVKAGMDLVALKKKYGERISFCGGMDIRALETNDPEKVEAELQRNLPTAMADGGYILHTDHSVSTRVDYETYHYFVRRGLEIGTY